MTKKLIVNGDDYGLTAGVSAGIRQANRFGILTSTSAMMNFPAAAEEVKLGFTECPKLGIGVHLVLTAGIPLSNPDQVTSLVTANGFFCKQDQLVENLDKINPDEVWREWNKQVDRYIAAAGKAPDHLDSHHHSSYFTPTLFEMMLRLADQLHCCIRRPWDLETSRDYLPEKLAHSTVDLSLLLNRYPGILTTDQFIGNFYDEEATLEHLMEILKDIKDDPEHDSFEIMCHPALVTEDLRKGSSYNDQRQAELEILTDSRVIGLIETSAIHLVSFSSFSN
jgi:chitin disaccharide deacetylase